MKKILPFVFSIGIILATNINVFADTTKITQAYGKQKDGTFHHGIDLNVPMSQMIKTNRAGVVLNATQHDVYGLVLVIDHGDIQALYAHNSQLLVKTGDEVKAGQPIAITGNTGNSTAPHVHFEIRVNGKPVDPSKYL